MKMLLNLGVSNPLTLGMAHPIADRLETLGRARPTTWRSRCLTLSAMGVLAIASAPLSIAEDTQDNVKTESAYKFIFDQTGKESQRFEVVTEDGVKKAYRILESGEREPTVLKENSDGTYRLSLSNGQPFDLPNIDFSEIENLKGLKGLAALKDLKGLTGLAALSDLQGIDFEDAEIHILNSSGTDLSAFNSDEFLAKFPKSIRDKIEFGGEFRRVKIVKSGDNKFDFENLDGESFSLPDSVIDLNVVFEAHNGSLAAANRQLERTKAQLEALAEDETLSFDLQNALRDLESAQKSLEAAEERLERAK